MWTVYKDDLVMQTFKTREDADIYITNIAADYCHGYHVDEFSNEELVATDLFIEPSPTIKLVAKLPDKEITYKVVEE